MNLKTYKFENKSAVKLEIYWYDGHSVSVDTNTNKTQFKLKKIWRKWNRNFKLATQTLLNRSSDNS